MGHWSKVSFLVRFSSFHYLMFSFVMLKLSFECIFTTTFIAMIWRCIMLVSYMTKSSASTIECRNTAIPSTFKFWSIMNTSFMSFQVRICTKSHLAELTFDWFCIVVWRFMTFERVRVPKSLITGTTFKRLNVLLQISHWNGFSPVWMRIWICFFAFSLNFLSQNSQENGFSPVWARLCTFKLDGRRNDFLQKLHSYLNVDLSTDFLFFSLGIFVSDSQILTYDLDCSVLFWLSIMIFHENHSTLMKNYLIKCRPRVKPLPDRFGRKPSVKVGTKPVQTRNWTKMIFDHDPLNILMWNVFDENWID